MLLLAFIALFFVLNNESAQQRIVHQWTRTTLDKTNLSVDFQGFEYSFPADLEIKPTLWKYKDIPLIELGSVTINGFFTGRNVGVLSLNVDTITLIKDVNDAIYAQVFKDIGEVANQTKNQQKPRTFQLGELKVDQISFLFNKNSISAQLASKNISVGKELTMGRLELSSELFGLHPNLNFENFNYTNDEGIRATFSGEESQYGSIEGDVKGIISEFIVSGDADLRSELPYEIVQNDYLSAFMPKDAVHFTFDRAKKRPELEFSFPFEGGDLRMTCSRSSDELMQFEGFLTCDKNLFKKPIFNQFHAFFDQFEPKNVHFSGKTDFSELTLSANFAAENGMLSLVMEGLEHPLNGEFNFQTLSLGPLHGLKGSIVLSPNIQSLIEGGTYSAQSVISNLESGTKNVRGVIVRYDHSLASDSIWLSSVDESFDAQLAYTRTGPLNSIKGEINTIALELLDPLDSGQFLTLNIDMNVHDNGNGSVLMENILLQRPRDAIFMRELSLMHIEDERVHNIELSSDVVDFSINGHWAFNDLPGLASHILQDVVIQKPIPWRDADCKYDLQVGNIGWLADLLHIDFELSEQSHFYGNYNGKNKTWTADFKVPHGHYNDLEGNGLVVQAQQKDDSNSFQLKADSILFKSLLLSDLDHVSSGPSAMHTFKTSLNIVDSIPNEIKIRGNLFAQRLNLEDAALTVGPAEFILNRPSMIRWNESGLTVDSTGFVSTQGEFWFTGDLVRREEPELKAYVRDLSEEILNYYLREDDYLLTGSAQADLVLKNSFSAPEIEATLMLEDLGVNNEYLGDLTTNVRFLNSNDVNIVGNLKRNQKQTASFISNVDLNKQSMGLRGRLKGFEIDAFNKPLHGVLDSIHGKLDARINVSGNWSDPKIAGDLLLKDAQFMIPYTGTSLKASRPLQIALDKNAFSLDTAEFFVPKDSTLARAWGQIYHSKFDSLNFDLSFEADSLRALDLERSIEGDFYGLALLKAQLNLNGPLEGMHLALLVETKDGTDFKIPLDNPTVVELPSFIRFANGITDQVAQVDHLDESYFTTDISISAKTNAQVELVLDEVLGDVIKARGEGNLKLKVLEDESIELFGLYTVKSGDYLFTLQNLVNKPFEIVPGGTILWSGDLYDAQIDLDAKYSLSTDLEGLVTNTRYNNENVDVDLIISLRGALLNPEISFKINLPNSPSSYQEELQRHFLNDEAMNYQAFSLLILGDFYQQNLAIQEGFSLGNTVTRNTSELLLSEFGSWLSAGIGSYVEIDFDYTNGTNPYTALNTGSDDNLNLAISKDFLDGRLQVNSSLDVPIENNSPSTLLLGDTEVVFSVTKNGQVKLRAFNRSNRNDPLMQNSGPYTQGVGLQYHKEFEKVIGPEPQ